jgi:hypothetical protein
MLSFLVYPVGCVWPFPGMIRYEILRHAISLAVFDWHKCVYNRKTRMHVKSFTNLLVATVLSKDNRLVICLIYEADCWMFGASQHAVRSCQNVGLM